MYIFPSPECEKHFWSEVTGEIIALTFTLHINRIRSKRKTVLNVGSVKMSTASASLFTSFHFDAHHHKQWIVHQLWSDRSYVNIDRMVTWYHRWFSRYCWWLSDYRKHASLRWYTDWHPKREEFLEWWIEPRSELLTVIRLSAVSSACRFASPLASVDGTFFFMV